MAFQGRAIVGLCLDLPDLHRQLFPDAVCLVERDGALAVDFHHLVVRERGPASEQLADFAAQTVRCGYSDIQGFRVLVN